jgi:hypothetical protein
MDDGREPESDGRSPYLRLPWPLVAAILFGVLAVLLALGFYANRNLRPQVGLSATPAPSAFSVAVAATATPPPVATPAPTSLGVVTLVSPTEASAAATAIPSPTLALAAIPAPTALPTVEPVLADEVGKAYVTYWRVRSQALLELDPVHLPDVMDGEYLNQFETQLKSLQMQGRAIKTQVTLNYVVVQASNETATIHDRVEDDSFYVVPGTQDPLTPPANDVLRLELKLRKSEGSWKVIDSVSAD